MQIFQRKFLSQCKTYNAVHKDKYYLFHCMLCKIAKREVAPWAQKVEVREWAFLKLILTQHSLPAPE